MTLRLEVVPPLSPATTWIEVFAAGQSVQAGATLPLRWQQPPGLPARPAAPAQPLSRPPPCGRPQLRGVMCLLQDPAPYPCVFRRTQGSNKPLEPEQPSVHVHDQSVQLNSGNSRGLSSKRTASGVSEPTGAELPPLCVRLLLQAAPARPYVLDDATVVRIIRVHRDQAEDLTMFQNQADRWKPDLA